MITWFGIWTFLKPVIKMALIFVVGHFIIVYLLRLIHRGFRKSKFENHNFISGY